MVQRVSQAKLDAIKKMADDGCSQREICRTLHVNARVVRRVCPGAGWTASEGGAHGRVSGRITRIGTSTSRKDAAA